MSIALALCASAVACPEVRAGTEIESIAQLRHDLFGDWIVPAWELVRVYDVGARTTLDGYAGLAWPWGFSGRADFDLYQLSLSGGSDRFRWSAGRFQALGSIRPQTVDGGSTTFSLSDGLDLEVWGGVARHQDLDDLLDGDGIARADLLYHAERFSSRTGVQAEYGETTPLVVRADVQTRLQGSSALQPHTDLRLALADRPAVDLKGAQIEWARLEAGLQPLAGLDTTVSVQRRSAADPNALFGDAILEALSGGSVDQAGGEVRIMGPRWAVFSTSYAFLIYHRETGSMSGHAVDASWTSAYGQGKMRFTPSYAFRSGPGGSYHALYATEDLDLGDFTQLGFEEGVVPFVKTGTSWQLAASAGTEIERKFGDWVRAHASADVATGITPAPDIRVGLGLVVSLP
jgi:hypothetical protein